MQVKEIAKMGVNMAAKANLYAVRSVATVSIIAVMMIAKESAAPGGTDWGITLLEVAVSIIAGVAAIGILALAIVKFREKKRRNAS
jgi:hypothetical protein